jgi:hypothetical protein
VPAQLVIGLWYGVRLLQAGSTSVPVVGLAVANQFLFLWRALPILGLVGWFCAKLPTQWSARLAVGTVWSLFVMVQAALEHYYMVVRAPLGADLFGYSLQEIQATIGGSTIEVAFTDYLGIVLPLVVLWTGLLWRPRRPLSSRPLLLSGVSLAGLGAWALPIAPGTSGLENETARVIATSKGAYFIVDNIRWLRSQRVTPIEDLSSELDDGEMVSRDDQGVRSPDATESAPRAAAVVTMGAVSLGTGPARGTIDPDYPFLRSETTPDALGLFFRPTRDGRPPNLVILMVEGLGRSFSGPAAPLGSFTPFLDELAGRSLYFENFLANQGRTFGILPSLVGSLPHAEQGFSALGAEMPPHAGLLNVLRRQGYRTSYYSGFDVGFDNARTFLERQAVDELIELRNFGSPRRPSTDWGYPDRDLISRVLEGNTRLRAPFATMIQTTSMHPLYEFPGQDAYKVRIEPRLDLLGIPEARRALYRTQADIFSTILYTDDQLRRYFESVASTPWYPNTIFVLTGDHRLPEIPQDTYLERFHVPLLIFSPLLRRPARLKGVSSHLDVTPSVLALLSNTYGLQRPAQVTWLGFGLDMSTSFRAQREFPMKLAKTSVPDYVSGRWFLREGRVYELQDGMRASEVENADLLAQVTRRLQVYQAANAVFLKRRALSPEGDAPRLMPFGGGPTTASVAGSASTTTAALAPTPVPTTTPTTPTAEVAPPGIVVASAPGLGIDEVEVTSTPTGIRMVVTFTNGEPHSSETFVPLAVLAAEDGRELQESYGRAFRLGANGRREVTLTMRRPAEPGRYFVSVRPSDPNTGKPVGRGRYRIPVDIVPAP